MTDGTIRLDKFLWQARFFKTRALSAQIVAAGKVRVNAQRVTRPGRAIRAGDTLTITGRGAVRVVTVLALPTRRGPAAEARRLYRDHDETRDEGCDPGKGGGPGKRKDKADGPHLAVNRPDGVE